MTKFLTTAEAAAYCGMSADDFRGRRGAGRGPRCARPDLDTVPQRRNPGFLKSDLDAWLLTFKRRSQAGAQQDEAEEAPGEG